MIDRGPYGGERPLRRQLLKARSALGALGTIDYNRQQELRSTLKVALVRRSICALV